MDQHNGNPFAAMCSMIVSFFMSFYAFILADAQSAAALIASIIAAISGLFAIRYYWYAAKEKKQNLKK